jgi:hypothetical protein
MGVNCMNGIEHAAHRTHGAPCDPGDPTARCGFCTLLAHTPVMAFAVDTSLVPVWLPPLSPPASPGRHESVYQLLNAQPRGPPHIG